VKHKYSVEVNGERVGTRSSARNYTHAIVARGDHFQGIGVISYCGSLALAEKAARIVAGKPYYRDVQIVPVTKG